MVEIVSEDVMEWARDLAALRKLFADGPLISEQAIVLQFSEYQQQPMMKDAAETIETIVCSFPTNIAAIKSDID